MTAAPPSLALPAEPGRVTDAQSMAALRHLLERVGFTEQAVSTRTGAKSIYDFTSVRQGRVPGEARDALDVLIRLFLDGDAMDRALIRQYLPDSDNAVRTLERLSLLRSPPDDPSKQFATVLLYPTNDLWMISDLPSTAAGAPKPLPADAVYPAITENTRDFLSSVPRTRCERFLEMCGGTGIAALIASRFSTRSWTGDITERSTRYARFNGELNNIDNFEPVQGDLYEPVRGLTFDRIVAHPPYIAAVEQTMIYRDGGPDGEQFTRALLKGLPEFLEPGGRYFMTCVATDRVNTPLEERVRGMIGESNAEFDVVVAVRATRDPVEYFRAVAKGGESTEQDAEAKIAAYAAIQAEKLVYASMAIERHGSPRTPFTARRSIGTAPVGQSLEWQLDWVRLRESPDFAQRILDATVHCRPDVRIRTEQRLVNGVWNVGRVDVSAESPFRTSVECSAETASILTRCTTPITLRDLARDLVADGLVGSAGAEAAVVSLVSFFVNAGYLDIDLLPAPAAVA
ncbi:MAG TPA: class I SAM-dependent methyltransferase [Gemmatimonadaceae bacterium]|nr:class I SAM-dependent methyltransferase [Gemmatimonadaceae bacterium]